LLNVIAPDRGKRAYGKGPAVLLPATGLAIAVLLAAGLAAAVLAGLSGCGDMAIGDKAKVERYLEEKYNGDFEVIVPEDISGPSLDGARMSFPVYAYNTVDPHVTFKVSEREDGEDYEDMYRVALLDRQVKELVDDALHEAGINAVCSAYCFFDDGELAKVQNSPGTGLLEYLSQGTTSVLELLLYIAIADDASVPQDLEAKLTHAFTLIDKRMLGKENAGYYLSLVETSDFAAFREEVDEYGIDAHPKFETATVVNYLSAQDSGNFSHQGHQRPLNESLSVLLRKSPGGHEESEG
jgi:hypothetical protein